MYLQNDITPLNDVGLSLSRLNLINSLVSFFFLLSLLSFLWLLAYWFWAGSSVSLHLEPKRISSSKFGTVGRKPNISTMVDIRSEDWTSHHDPKHCEDRETTSSLLHPRKEDQSIPVTWVDFLKFTWEIPKLNEALLNPLVYNNGIEAGQPTWVQLGPQGPTKSRE